MRRPSARRQRRLAPLAVALVTLALVAAACGNKEEKSTSGGSTGGAAKQGGVFRLGIVEPTAIDPYNSQESEGELVTKVLFEGLVKIDNKTSDIVPGVAERWDHNPDCTQWTFHLRPGTKFSSGEVVTARSFIDGMNRSAAKDAASDTAHFMSDIDGYDAVHGGTAPTMSGLTAPDDNTLLVKLSQPNCEFDKKTLQPVFSPVPTEAGKADPNSAYYNMPVGNGPFKMKEPWQHNTRITLVRNDLYYGTKAHLDEVDVTILPAENAQELEYKNFQAGQAEWARIPPTLQPQAKATYEPQHEWIAEPKFGINYLLVNVVNPPLDNVKARQAISLAIDRDAVIEGVFKGLQTKATSLVSPALRAYYQAGVCGTCDKPDPARAKQLAVEGGMPPGTKLNFLFNTGGGHEAWVQAVAQQLRDTLGLDVNLQGIPFKELLEREKANDASGIFRAAWSADYPSADAFLRPLLSKASLPPGDNRGRYVNDRFDSLLDQASRTSDTNQRVSYIKDAERIAIGDDQALIPLWYRTQYRVFSNRFKNVDMDFFENPTLADISLA